MFYYLYTCCKHVVLSLHMLETCCTMFTHVHVQIPWAQHWRNLMLRQYKSDRLFFTSKTLWYIWKGGTKVLGPCYAMVSLCSHLLQFMVGLSCSQFASHRLWTNGKRISYTRNTNNGIWPSTLLSGVLLWMAKFTLFEKSVRPLAQSLGHNWTLLLQNLFLLLYLFLRLHKMQ